MLRCGKSSLVCGVQILKPSGSWLKTHIKPPLGCVYIKGPYIKIGALQKISLSEIKLGKI